MKLDSAGFSHNIVVCAAPVNIIDIVGAHKKKIKRVCTVVRQQQWSRPLPTLEWIPFFL